MKKKRKSRSQYYYACVKSGRCWNCGKPRGKDGSGTLCGKHRKQASARMRAVYRLARQARAERIGTA